MAGKPSGKSVTQKEKMRDPGQDFVNKLTLTPLILNGSFWLFCVKYLFKRFAETQPILLAPFEGRIY